MIFQYVICHGDKPLRSVGDEFLIFATKKAAHDKVKHMKSLGDTHIYGKDEFRSKDLKIKVNYIYI